MKRYLFITCLVFLGIIGISAKKEQTPIHRLILQGDSCMNEHDSFHAITYYQQYINEHPHDLNVLRKLASCYRLRGDNKKCIACMDSIPNDSLNHEDLRMMFYSYLNLGDKKKVESWHDYLWQIPGDRRYLPPYFSNGTTMGSLKAFQHSPCRMLKNVTPRIFSSTRSLPIHSIYSLDTSKPSLDTRNL